MLIRLTVPLLAAGLALAACEPAEDTPSQDAPLDQTVPGDSVPADSLVAMAPDPGELTPINRSGVRGRAQLDRDGDDIVVTVEADSLQAGTRYTAAVYEGRCSDGGPVALPVGEMTASGQGSGSIRMEFGAGRVPAEGELFLQLNDADDRPVACANLDPDES